MKHLIYILTICFAVVLMSSCQKTELDDLKPMKVTSEERVEQANGLFPGQESANGDSDSDDDNGGGNDTITDDDDEDDDDEIEGRTVTKSD